MINNNIEIKDLNHEEMINLNGGVLLPFFMTAKDYGSFVAGIAVGYLYPGL